ncbi:hypothetical protein QQS21_007465 [Conoideocrella luteorostrata]|uniref:Fringe-like glycosyltransferase domain-containing protein n=1 Tax=Conoideocrella luteorostrata TaxID=1105319 RepID=A0AAJ0FSE4_9HYPO|nr:hypothetical protein QQS21_007465 [Conoideocrella luteorostrata]
MLTRGWQSRQSAKRAILMAILMSPVLLLVIFYMRPYSRESNFRSPPALDTSHQSGKESQTSRPPGVKAFDEINCQWNDTRLVEIKDRYGLQDKFQYVKRLVRFSRKPHIRREIITKLSQPLLKDNFQLVDTSRPGSGRSDCSDAIEVPVTASGFPQKVDASDFMFGISTTYDRFLANSTLFLNDWKYWLTDGAGKSNGGKLVLMLTGADARQLDIAHKLVADAGIDVELYESDSASKMAVRYLTLVPTMYNHQEARRKKWLVLCDDDTFFPYMHTLITRLADYDHTREMYIGALSEEVFAILRHGSQAFGGAGVFLSLPTAKKITEFFDICSSNEKLLEAEEQGDRILQQCIYQHSETKLSTIWDLWQLDLEGDPAGFYEWGIQPLSLHHYRSWHNALPSEFTKISYACGEDCTLQRFQTTDNFIISGYSIANYPKGIDFDTRQIEATFRSVYTVEGGNFDYKFGPQRQSLVMTGRKNSWELRESSILPDGSVLQTYVRLGGDPRWVQKDNQPINTSDGVIELIWAPSESS